MNTSNTSIFEKAYNPVLQAAATFGAVIVFILISKLVKLTGLMYVSDLFPWMTAAAFMLLFAVFNSIFSLSANNMAKYWGRSIYSYMGLAAASGFVAYLFSSLTISEAGSYRWIYVVLSIGYLVFLSIMGFMKRIVEFAQREEWHHPRIRRRK
jgi:drug/metabolite transporter (DMT)-like permease